MKIHIESKQQDRDIIATFIALIYVLVAHWTYLNFVNTRLCLATVLVLSIMYFLSKCKSNVYISVYNFQMLLICGGSLIGVTYSTGFSDGIRFSLQIILATVLVIVLQNSKKVMDAIYRALTVSGLVCVIFILIQWFMKSDFNKFLFTHLQSEAYQETITLGSYGYMTGLSGYTSIAGFISACIIGVYGINFTLSPKKKIGHNLRSVVIMFLSIIALVMTQKRGLFIAVICSFLVVLVVSAINQKNGKRIIGMIIFGLVIALVLSWVLINTESGRLMMNRFLKKGDFSSGRYELWRNLLSDLDGIHLLIGHGTGATAATYNIGAHNIFIQILYDNGVVMLFLYLIWFISSIMKTITMRIHGVEQDKKRYISLFVQIVFIIYGFVGNPLYDFCLLMIYIYYTTLISMLGKGGITK